MKETKEYIDELIANYMADRLTGNMLTDLKEWIDASPDNKKYFVEQQEIWFSAMHCEQVNKYNTNRAFAIFKKRINKEKRSNSRKVIYRWRYVAAVVVLLIIGGLSYWQGSMSIKNRFENIVIEAPLGSRTKLFLPDGTLVWLNAGTRITYSQGFGVENREVVLEGEGYFEVTKNKEVPFFVKTKELGLKVLGTKFNFRDYPEDIEVVVSLLEGEVELDNFLSPNKKCSLKSDERALLNKQTGKMEVESVIASNSSEWTAGYLFFDEELLPDIVKELERSYNVKIQLADTTLNNFRFYGNFTRKEQTIEEVMEVLSSTGKIEYTKEGREIIIY